MNTIKLKNYTSTVSAITSMARIQEALVQAGATDISMKYVDKSCTAVTFRMELPGGIFMFFKLPAKVQPCFDVLWKEVKRPRSDTKKTIQTQAERTAWKIVADWVEIQLSMILLKQAEPLQVFLSYKYNPETDKTFYEQIKESNFNLLLPSSK